MKYLAIASITALAVSSLARSEVRPAAIFQSHMVMQQASEAPIWGWADPDEQVEIRASWADAPVRVSADKEGAWRASLKTPAATVGAAPATIEIKGKNTVTLTDVLIGEVWVCSGQSNMEMFVSNANRAFGGVDRWEDELKTADIPGIRLFDVKNAVAAGPRENCEGTWAVCTGDRAKHFSATAFFFGRELHRSLGVPVGLITADWGGTPAESWTSAQGLAPFSQFAEELSTLAKIQGDPVGAQRVRETTINSWRAKVREVEVANEQDYRVLVRPSNDHSGWPAVEVPSPAFGGDLAQHDGFFWLRREFQLPAGAALKPGMLSLGPIDDCDSVWINGILVGETIEDGKSNSPRTYPVADQILVEGRNVIAVRVLDTGGPAGMGGKPEQYVLKPAAVDVPPVPLAGTWHCWRGIELAKLPPRPKLPTVGPWTPSALYNGMIAPVQGIAMRGAIWYQGESNRDRAFQYRTLFPAMIRDWRANWGLGDFPFYYVQIAPFKYGGDTGQAAELREAQMLALSVPNTGMAVTMDIGDPRDIHPRNKQDVGKRLAFLALNRTYGKGEVPCFGPVFKAMAVDGGKVRLSFDHTLGELGPTDKPLAGFTVAGEDKVFVPAQATIEGETVVVWSDTVAAPVAVRYGWGAADAGLLRNKAGLPASSFRTDDWPMLTAPK